MKTPEKSRFSKLVAYLLDPQGKETRVGEVNITKLHLEIVRPPLLALESGNPGYQRGKVFSRSSPSCGPDPWAKRKTSRSFITTPELQKKAEMRFGLRNFAGWNALYSL